MGDKKLEVLEDFSAGINTNSAPNRIAKNQLVDGFNFYYVNGALVSRTGSTFSSTITVDTSTAIGASFCTFEAYNTFMQAGNGTATLGTASEYLFIAGGTASGTPATCVKYTPDATTFYNVAHYGGTVSTTSGSPIVTGAGTLWSGKLLAGDMFQLGWAAGVVRFKILSVDSDTQITLTANFTSTVAGSAYNVLMAFPGSTALTTAGRLRMFNFNGLMHFVPSYDLAGNARTWNGLALGVLTSFPAVKFSSPFKNYVFGARTSANPSRVQWSALKDSTSWPAANFIDVNPDDGQAITGLIVDDTSLIILKRNGAYRLTGDVFDPTSPTYALTKISTPSNFYIDTSRSAAFFRGQWVLFGVFGIYTLSGNVITELPNSKALTAEWASLSTPVFSQTIPFSQTTWNFVDSPYTEKTAFVYKDVLYITGQYNARVGNSEGPTVAFSMDASGSLWKHTETSYSAFVYGENLCFQSMQFLNGLPYAIEAGNSRLFKFDTGNLENGVQVAATATTKVFEFAKQQRFGLTYVYFKKQSAGNMSFDYRIDEGTYVTNTIDMTAGTGTRVKSAPLVIGRVGRAIQFRFTNNVATPGPIELYAVSYEREELRQ